MSKALEIAKELKANMLAVANGKIKPGKMPIEPICRAYSELLRLHLINAELLAMLDKLEYSSEGNIKRYPAEAEVNAVIAKGV